MGTEVFIINGGLIIGSEYSNSKIRKIKVSKIPIQITVPLAFTDRSLVKFEMHLLNFNAPISIN